MKLSNLLAASLTLVSAVAVFASSAEARNPAKGLGNGGSTLQSVPTVFPAECGTDAATQAFFGSSDASAGSQGNVPLTAIVNESTVLTSGYAGDLVFVPTSNLVLTDLTTFTAMPQGNYSSIVSVRPTSYNGDPALEFAVAYSYTNANGKNPKTGISFVPATFVTNVTPVTNHALKLKSVETTVTLTTNLQTLNNARVLVNVIDGTKPGVNAANFQLLGIGQALVNLGGAGTAVNAQFANFKLNNATLQTTAGLPNASVNINCAPFLPVNGGQ